MEYKIVSAIIIGYLLGSIPFSYIVTRLKKGVDIRKIGGGNAGALNTYREVGPVYGIGVLAADIAKGAFAVLIAKWLDVSLAWVCVAGFAAVVGHNWPVFLQFRGGKGAATVIGALLALTPVPLLITGGIVLVLIAITHNVRLSLGALVLTPLFTWIFYDDSFTYIMYGVGLLVFIGLVTAVSLKTELADENVKRNLIIEKDHRFWHKKKAR